MGGARFYVYAHVRSDDNVIFYIGKGCKKRAWSRDNRNPHWKNTVQKHGFNVVVLADALTEQQAVDEEAHIIAHFMRFGALVNILERGDVNPMSNPMVAKKVAETKRAKGQYSGDTIRAYNEQYRQRMVNDVDFALAIKVKRQKAARASWAVRNENARNLINNVFKLLGEDLTQTQIAKQLCVSEATVSRIKNRKAYVGVS